MNDARKHNSDIVRGNGKNPNYMKTGGTYASGGRASGQQAVFQDMKAKRTGSNIKRRG